MEYVVGIDGGGTKTKLVICNLEGVILEVVESGPSNLLSSGYEVTKASITEVISKGMGTGQYGIENCIALCIGAAGAGRVSVKQQLEQIIREAGYKGHLIITHDGETALVGGVGTGGEGVLIIAGTGTICYGRNKEGKTQRVSGWGHLIGDEGSAYDIGVHILKAVMKAYDGRGKETIFTELLLKRMKLQSPEEIIAQIYHSETAKEHIAAYATLLDEAYAQGDEVAYEIVEESTKALYECVSTTLIGLGLTNRHVKVMINGSVLLKNIPIRTYFTTKLEKAYPQVEVGTILHDAAYGAAIIARDLLMLSDGEVK